MTDSIYEAAAAQALERAAGYGETAELLVIMSVFLFFVFILCVVKDWCFIGMLSLVLSLMFIFVALSMQSEASSAKHRPELYVVEKLQHKTDHYPLFIPVQK